MKTRSLILNLILGTSLLTAPVIAANSLPVIQARPTCEVAGSQVTLQDFATVTGADSELSGKLNATVVSPAPLAGRNTLITRDRIIIAIRRQGIQDSAYSLLCPAMVNATRATAKISGQSLFDAAQQYIMANHGLQGTVSVEAVRLPNDVTAPAGKIEIKAKDSAMKIRKGRTSVSVEAIVDGKTYSTTSVQVLVKLVAPVLVATQPISKSDPITSANTTTQEQDVTYLPEDIVTGVPTGDVIAAAPIQQGAILRPSWITVPPVIKSGDSVAVVVIVGSVRVCDMGFAAADGRPGDRIKVKMDDSREVRGTVVGPGMVEINISGRNS